MASDPDSFAERSWMHRVERSLGALAAHNHRRPVVALLCALLLSGVGLLCARNLTLNANLADLLPDSFKSVQAIKTQEERYGALGWVVVVGDDADPEQLQRFAKDLAPKLEALPGIRYVEITRPSLFFRDHALYFLSPEDLKEVERRIEARLTWERLHANPLFVSLEDDPAPSLDFSDLEKKYGGNAVTRLSNNPSEFYLDPAERRVVVLAKPETSSSDLTFSRKIVDEVQGVVKQQDLSKYGPGFHTEITGTFQKKLDLQSQITRDVAVASSVAGVLVLLYLFLHFRSMLAVGMVLAPVGAGLAWTYGLVGVAYGQVNILTAFLGAILGGLGVEHGIHLLGRYLSLRGEGMASEQATRESFTHTGGAALVSALVAALTFFVLGTSGLRAFREFGVIAGVGMLVIILAYVLVLPAVLGLVARHGWSPRRTSTETKEAPLGRIITRRRWVLTAVSALIVVGLLTQMPRVRFDYKVSSLEDDNLPSFVLDRAVNQLIGYTQMPLVVLTDSREEEAVVVKELQARKQQLGADSKVDFVASLESLVPGEQARKQVIMRDIGKLLEGVPEGQLTAPQREELAELRRQVRAAPFSVADLPAGVRQQFEGRGEKGTGFVVVYPSVDQSDGQAMRKLAKEVRGVALPDGRPAVVAGESLVLADILDLVSHEAPFILLGSTLAVLLAMWLTLGGLRTALLCLMPTVVSVFALLGLMPLMKLEFNYLNILVIPVLIGTTVDAGVHLITRLASPESDFVRVYSETGKAICGGLLTSAVGFGALFLADHPGLNSIGALANLGFGMNLLVMLVTFPALLLVLSERKRRRRAVPSRPRGEHLVDDGQGPHRPTPAS
ncbi:MMPL family transporter [Corallococcus sp. bb12-1]|uniref:efflux RND transporter permease subunit n=1 Tax=Corallococcus sp. bb12-1 TaxID=2996784 RepID=UPI00226DFAC4|nr:MMPL family transporter [Corallococcus sp. bb12-1]MCY1046630.1 MMPL family transporter [Corallococcus sp. bb12-1]